MDDKMMKAGGAAKRQQLIEMFGEHSISTTQTRELTEKEKKIARGGDTGQANRLLAAKK